MSYIIKTSEGNFGPFTTPPRETDTAWVTDGLIIPKGVAKDGVLEEVRHVAERNSEDYEKLAKRVMDEEAQAYGYESITEACSYALSQLPELAAEGTKFLAYRDSVMLEIRKVSQKETGKPSAKVFTNKLPKPDFAADYVGAKGNKREKV